MRTVAAFALVVTVAACFAAGRSDSAPMRQPLFKAALVSHRAISVSARKLQHSHRFLVAQALVRGLRSTPIARQAWVLEAVSHADGINPFFIVGAAGTESSVWRASCSSNPKNGWGLSSCGSGWYVPYFRTWAQAFDFYARYIRRQWPSARTPYDLHGYCPPCGDRGWGDKTVAWIHQLFGNVPTTLAYP